MFSYGVRGVDRNSRYGQIQLPGVIDIGDSWPRGYGRAGRCFSRSRAGVRLQENWHEECPD
jgi:hypothetical protein